MFNPFRRLLDRRIIDRGRVSCPNGPGDAQVEICAACPWLVEIDVKARVPYLRCEACRAPLGEPPPIL